MHFPCPSLGVVNLRQAELPPAPPADNTKRKALDTLDATLAAQARKRTDQRVL